MGLPNNPGEEGPRAEWGHRQTTEVRDIYPHPAMPHNGTQKKAKQVPPQGGEGMQRKARGQATRERGRHAGRPRKYLVRMRGGPQKRAHPKKEGREEGGEGEGE